MQNMCKVRGGCVDRNSLGPYASKSSPKRATGVPRKVRRSALGAARMPADKTFWDVIRSLLGPFVLITWLFLTARPALRAKVWRAFRFRHSGLTSVLSTLVLRPFQIVFLRHSYVSPVMHSFSSAARAPGPSATGHRASSWP